MTPVTSPRREAVLTNELLVRLREAIDTDAMTQRLNAQWSWLARRGLRATRVEVHRVFPRGLDSFVVKYLLLLDDGATQRAMTLFGEIQPEDAATVRARVLNKLRKSRRKQIDRRDDNSDAVTVLPELNLLLRVPGYDEKLPGLTLRHQPKRARQFLRELLAPREVAPDAQVTTSILNHRLGKRCVMRAHVEDTDDSVSVVLRCLKANDRRHLDNVAQMLKLSRHGFGASAADRIRIPRVLGCSDELATVAIEDMPGQILGESRRWPLTQQAAVAGRTLGKLHACPIGLARYHRAAHELALLREWVLLTQILRPELIDGLESAQIRVDAALTAQHGIPRLSHRDYYSKQLLYDGEQAVLIDFDTLCMAEPALDIGNYLAHRELALLTGEPADPDETDAFLQAYDAKAPLPPATAISAWRDAALLRLACLYALHSGWGTVSGRLLQRIGERI